MHMRGKRKGQKDRASKSRVDHTSVISCSPHNMFLDDIDTEIKMEENNTILSSEDLAIGSQVQCIGSTTQCCSISPQLTLSARMGLAPSGIGSWRYPNGSYVLLGLAGHSYGITRQIGQVVLHRQGQHMVEGIWRCEVPNEEGENVTLYVGFYHQGGGMY